MAEGEHLKFKAIKPEQHFTEPPPRYNEATLVKRLEADGVGRPSTYASILSTIQEREYVKKEGGRFKPTELGMVVTDLLLESFDDIFDVSYTARMEEELDEIEEGKLDWRTAMAEFYERFDARSEARRRAHDRHQADGKAHRLDVREVRQAPGDQVGQARQLHRLHRLSRMHLHPRTHRRPARCGQGRSGRTGRRGVLRELRPSMVLKKGRFGTFFACSGYPDCKTTKQIGGTQKKADVAARRKVPAMRQQPGAEDRPLRRIYRLQQLPGLQVRQAEDHRREMPGVFARARSSSAAPRRARPSTAAIAIPDCNFVAWGKPVAEKCPECGSPYLVEKWLKAGPVWQCPNPECKHKQDAPQAVPA